MTKNKMDNYFSICSKYYGTGLEVKLSVIFCGVFTGNDLYKVNQKINKEFTNRWIERQAKELGLKVCYVKLKGES